MSDRPETDDGERSPLSSNLAARLRSTNLRTAIAAACAAIGAAAVYMSLLIEHLAFGFGQLLSDLPRFQASLALWPAGMILILVALLVQPPGRARVYTRSAFVLTMVAITLALVFAYDHYPFAHSMVWWRDWFNR